MEVQYVILVLAAGVAGGFLNVLAGGGSLITMPVLIFMGLPSAMANGTNRVALMVQNIVAITNFRSKGYFSWKLSVMLGIPAVLGAVCGAQLAVSLPDEVFNKILGIIMLLVVGLIIWQPQKKLSGVEENLTVKRKIAAAVVFFFIGVYGGFIQAGVGFFIIAAMVFITGMSLVKINSIKVFVVAIYMLFSLGVFVFHGQVDWVLGATLAAGNAAGAWLGSNFAVARGDKWIRVVLFIAVILMAAKLLGIFDVVHDLIFTKIKTGNIFNAFV